MRCRAFDINSIDAKTLNGHSDYWRGAKSLSATISPNQWYRIADVTGDWFNGSFILSVTVYQTNQALSYNFEYNYGFGNGILRQTNNSGYNYSTGIEIRIVRAEGYRIRHIEVKNSYGSNYDIKVTILELVGTVNIVTPFVVSSVDGTVESSIVGSASQTNAINSELIDNELNSISGGGRENFSIRLFAEEVCRTLRSIRERREAV